LVDDKAERRRVLEKVPQDATPVCISDLSTEIAVDDLGSRRVIWGKASATTR
jgi:hypothetical protein